MRDEESNKIPVPSISFPHVHHGLLKGKATLAHQTQKGMSSGKLPAICMSLDPQQQRVLSLWVLKGLITFSLSGKKLDLLQCSCIFCSWMICLAYTKISLYHSGILETVYIGAYGAHSQTKGHSVSLCLHFYLSYLAF